MVAILRGIREQGLWNWGFSRFYYHPGNGPVPDHVWPSGPHLFGREQDLLWVAMSETLQMAIDFMGWVHQETKPWWMNFRSQDPRSLSPRILLATPVSLHVCYCHFSLLSGVSGHGKNPTALKGVWSAFANIPFYWIFLHVDLLWRWLPSKLYFLTETMNKWNKSVSLNRILMIEAF